MSQLDLAWLAGFWDGEGSVGLIRNGKTLILVAQFSHTELATVRHVLSIIESHGVRGRGYTYQERDPAKHRDAHYVRITGIANVLELGRLLLPYAITKRRHWEIAVAWAENRISIAGGVDSKGHLLRGGIYNSNRGYSMPELVLADELATLNRRGPRDRQERSARRGRIAA